MTPDASGAIVRRRLYNLRLLGAPLARLGDVIGWLGAVQSQDYGPAKWSVGMRVTGATDAQLDRAYAEGAILRTHVLRPTWHFVLPADIRWLLTATAPRVQARNAYRAIGSSVWTRPRLRIASRCWPAPCGAGTC